MMVAQCTIDNVPSLSQQWRHAGGEMVEYGFVLNCKHRKPPDKISVQ